ncbi:MAG: hypothetical protein J6Y04_01760 [Bacteroidaceae bacterium]|nr:hypothetical protein [Bacteroidaceae bacterium]
MEDLKKKILQQVYNSFVNSSGYNGCPVYDLGYDCTQEELLQCLIELIKEEKIEIISGDVGNTYIKSFDAESIEKQITLLPSLSPFDYCIYPTESVLENKRDVSNFNDRPFSKMLALGKPQMKCRLFNIDILYHYAADPRYDYSFRDYFGSIYSYNTVEDSEAIYLSNFSIGRNGDDYVVAVFLRDLNFLPAVAQQKWYSKMIVDSSKCLVLRNFIDNQLLGSWCFPRTVFRAIVEEIENLYVLTNYIWGKSIVSNCFLRDDDRLREFEMLLLPTKKNLDDFYSQLEIITVGNLNKDFFSLDEFGLELFLYTQDGDYQIKTAKGTLLLLKEWLQIVKPECVKEIHGVLNEVRATRSKGRAHNLLRPQYSKDFYTEQFDISGKVFNALNVLRRIIQTHPRAKGAAIPHDSNCYVEI